MLPVLTVILLLVLFLFVIAVLLVLVAAIDVVFEAKGSGLDVEHTVTVHWLMFSRVVSPSEDDGREAENDDEIPEELREAGRLVAEHVKAHSQGSEKDEKEKKNKKKKGMDMSYSEMLQTFRQLRSPVFKLLKGIICAMRVHYAKVNAVYGFPDPAYTGMACGYACALKGYLETHSEKMDLQLEPDFLDSRLDIDMSGTVRIRLYRFIPVILLFIMDRNVLRFSWRFLMDKMARGKAGVSGVNL